MRTLLILWLTPIFLLSSWYGLSYHDINFGTLVLSRELHDLVFDLYGKILGVAPETIPMMVLKAIIFDSFLIMGIIAYRLRKKWWPTVSAYFKPENDHVLGVVEQGNPAE